MSELGSIDNPVKFKDQDFDALLQNCLKSAVLFSDTVFAANQSSLGIPVDPDPKKAVKWLRPKVTLKLTTMKIVFFLSSWIY